MLFSYLNIFFGLLTIKKNALNACNTGLSTCCLSPTKWVSVQHNTGQETVTNYSPWLILSSDQLSSPYQVPDPVLNAFDPWTTQVCTGRVYLYGTCIFSIDTVDTFSFPYDFLNMLFSLACFIVRRQYVTHMMYKVCVNWLFILLVRFWVTRRLVIIKFGGESKVYADFWMCSCPVLLTTMLFRSQLHLQH